MSNFAATFGSGKWAFAQIFLTAKKVKNGRGQKKWAFAHFWRVKVGVTNMLQCNRYVTKNGYFWLFLRVFEDFLKKFRVSAHLPTFFSNNPKKVKKVTNMLHFTILYIIKQKKVGF